MVRVLASLLVVLLFAPAALARTVTDGFGRTVEVPDEVSRVICSGSGCLRLLTYLQGSSLAVGADDMESRRRAFDARPYALAHPEYKKLPVFGEFRGHDNPERIVTLDPAPQVIFKTQTSGIGYDPDELEAKTGIPVVVLVYGDLAANRHHFYESLRLMGEIVGKAERAEAVVEFFESRIKDLARRTHDIADSERKSAFIGGVAFRGPHGYRSTEPAYPPFLFVNAKSPAYEEGVAGKKLKHADVAKEKILEWDPDYLFLDLSTLRLGEEAGGLFELRTDPAYRALSAVQAGRVYGVLPYNFYTKNYGSILADAYFVGKTLYPLRFTDIEPAAEADAIYSFLVGAPVFEKLDADFDNLAFKPVPVN